MTENTENLFENFLTAEDEFRMEMEEYMPEFMVRLKMDTLYDDPEFIERTLELQKLGEKAGIDMQQFIIDYGKANGYE